MLFIIFGSIRGLALLLSSFQLSIESHNSNTENLDVIVHKCKLEADEMFSRIYNLEQRAMGNIRESFIPIAEAHYHDDVKLLCCVFANISSKVLSLMSRNIGIADGFCSWAIIAYAGEERLLKQFLSLHADQIVFAKLFEEHVLFANSKFNFVPKVLMYPLVQPFLHFFRWVWFLDEDISLQGFHFVKLMNVLHRNHGSKYSPLIMQPTLHETTQWVPTFSKHFWYFPSGKSRFPGATGAYVRFIEQQMPIFRSDFLSWYLQSVIIPVENITRILRSNWGIENLWCKAAEVFVSFLLDTNSSDIPACMVIVDSELVVHHLHTKSISMKRGKKLRLYRELSLHSVNLTSRLFPTWYSDIKGSKIMGSVKSILYRTVDTLNKNAKPQIVVQ